MRDEAEAWMDDTLDIYRVTTSEDAYGGVAQAEALLASAVPCMVQSGVEHVQALPLQGVTVETHLFTITLPAEQDVQMGDVLVLTSKNGERLRVQALLFPLTREIMRQVIASTQAA